MQLLRSLFAPLRELLCEFEMGESPTYVLEWRIGNISCWNKVVHGMCIKSPLSDIIFPFHIELYPRGISGVENHMVVRICGKITFSRGHLSLIGSDGSLMCMLEGINGEKNNDFLELTPERKFEEVVAHIKKNESEHKDHLTLRLCVPSNFGRYYEQRISTIIGVSKTCLKIYQKDILNTKLDKLKRILRIPCFRDECFGGLFLKASPKDEAIEFILEPLDVFKKVISLEIQLSLHSKDNSLVRCKEKTRLFRDKSQWEFSCSLKIEEQSKRIDHLIMRLKIINGSTTESNDHVIYNKMASIVPNSICFPEQKPSINPAASIIQTQDPSKTELRKELMSQKNDFSDLQLKCGTVSFPVHRAILSARSSVFKNLLSFDMRDDQIESMPIDDLDVSTLRLFLAFLYTERVDHLQGESALKLYYAAERYHVPTLRKKCVDFLRDNVSVSNVCDILSLADNYADSDLNAVCHRFILDNYSGVLGSNEWETLMKRESFLTSKLLTLFAQKKFVGKSASRKRKLIST